LTQAPTADASRNSQQAFQVHFEDKSLRNVRFKNVANFSVLVWGAVKPAPMKAASSRRTPTSRDRWSWLKNVQTPDPVLKHGANEKEHAMEHAFQYMNRACLEKSTNACPYQAGNPFFH
jgi:hypothetical protein